ncbi:McrC family protein [Rudanella lutea]|uniref:McrC family protein n=1 Tax=Rudanella lutea TaxID=451374 RepID=UPI0003784DA1|nr:hypothetical protein [Rudanella lutea]
MRQLINLVEYQTYTLPTDSAINVVSLSAYLNGVWHTRTQFDENPDVKQSSEQQFLTIGYDPKLGQPTLKAGKYVGFIQFEDTTIQIIPKLFKPEQSDKAFRHLLWWLSYCKRVRFPFTDLLSDTQSIDEFPEALIHYFAQFTHQLVGSAPYHQYEEVTDTIPYMRGRLNTQQYINTSVSRGNWHQLVCDYEPFVFNNRLNQIIKYVARSLSQVCRFTDTHRALEKLIFILDEVDDVPAIARDCDTLHLNRYFADYEVCVDMCRFFLSDSYLSQPETHHRHFCFLLPMDYVFEDFILGVSETYLGHKVSVSPQKTEWLTQEKIFQVKSDLVLTYPDKTRLVADTKYKVRGSTLPDKKAGISQSDLYQMVSYGLRQETRDVLLLYPLSYGQEQTGGETFHVNSVLLNNIPICIRAVDLPITGELTSDIQSRQLLVSKLVSQLLQAFNLKLLE